MIPDFTTCDSMIQPMMSYNKSSSLQAQMNEHGISVLKKLAQALMKELSAVPRNTKTTFTIGDYGCSHGANSMAVVNGILSSLQELEGNKHLTIHVYHNDLPNNDFGELLKCLDNPDLSYLNHTFITGSPAVDVLTMLSAKSFFTQCVPSGSIDLGVCFNSVHWLHTIPVTMDRPLTFASAEINASQANLIRDEGHRELVSYFASRSAELSIGGHLVTSVIQRYDCLKRMDDIWQHHINEANINPKLLDTTSVAVFCRSKEDIYRALSLVPTLRLVSYAERIFTEPFNKGEAGMDIMEAACYPQILAGLKKRQVFANEAIMVHFVDEYFRKLRLYYASSEDEYLMSAYVAVQRV
ncbi:S-adenosyl-L-methionine-dependent methyltransferase [Basidiobolus meristosporus CBS 931.73]|uniref:S-adenosyl-L-methionine-dependent methyltransferase n=1 Tax=Basidiobolus meristosporus CBS 931.73 TaxID=1314790 RepID=A0A1Y1XCG4_9FUNG|nr:S-adenosyl-L-methionine-dependent methyltransferase [Basidiobolus meristosporus CBS 931.73]|eukprot:ORX83413.1 S-adenosyl-L-methionine-dependent methyltransferase [Basidiobolus meristosporus CBS 931.73]